MLRSYIQLTRRKICTPIHFTHDSHTFQGVVSRTTHWYSRTRTTGNEVTVICLTRTFFSTAAQNSAENTKVDHSQFLATASPHSKWNDSKNVTSEPTESELEGVTDTVGKLLPTSSHLFKLILPLNCAGTSYKGKQIIPTVLLLHPAQPLSHVSKLILASLPPSHQSRASESSSSARTVSFRSSSAASTQYRQFQWSDSTDVADFIRDAARAAQFSIHITNTNTNSEDSSDQIISVRVPTFADRTRYLRRRLDAIEHQLRTMEGLKRECDLEAYRGARRMAMGGFGMLIVYWAAVARLTFWDYGWDVMEPITYLSGLSTVICGYLWFLYQGREVSYSSVLDRSVSARRHALYKQRGLDIDKWLDLVAEQKSLMKEIGKIKEDYEQPEREDEEEAERKERVDKEGD